MNPINEISLSKLEKLRLICLNHVNYVRENGDDDEDIEHFIYEAAMELVFGDDVWNYLNPLYR